MLQFLRRSFYATMTLMSMLGLSVASQAADSISLELNKVTQQGNSCRLHFLLTNNTDIAFQTFRLQIAFFDKSGGFVNNATADFLRVRPKKTVLRYFDVPELHCTDLGEVLLNDAASCETENEQVADCIELIAATHRAEVRFYK